MSTKQAANHEVPIQPFPRIPFRCAGLTIDIRLKELAVYPLLDIIIRG